MIPCAFTGFTNLLYDMGLSIDERLFAFQLLAWARQSDAIQALANQPDIKLDKLLQCLNEWGQSSDLGENQRAFPILGTQPFSRIKAEHLQPLLSYLEKYRLNEPLSTKALVAELFPSTHAKNTLPSEVCQLMVVLTAIQPDDKVYLPFDPSLQLTVKALDYSKHTYTEQTTANPLPALVNLLCDQNIQVHTGDCIDQPGFLENCSLARFERTVAFPGFGKRHDPLELCNDPYQRFVEQTAAIAILAVRHVMASTTHRAVVAVPNGLLYTMESQRLREDLVKQGHIETIIAMPGALLSWAGIPFSIWILCLDKPSNDVLFIDATGDSFWTVGDDKRRRFTGNELLTAITAARTDEEHASLVPTQQILANQAKLNVTRYCKTQEQKCMDAFWAQFEATCQLSDIATLHKATALPFVSDTQAVFQLNPADIQAYGYSWPSYELDQNQLAGAKPLRRIRLEPHDLVVVTRGGIGQVALIPLEMPSPEQAIWVVAETCSVIRLKQLSRFDARVLHSFLRSEIGWNGLSQTIIGAQNRIELSALMAMEIPVLTEPQQNHVLEQFECIIEMDNQIQQLQLNKKTAAESVWQAFIPQ